MAANCWRTRSMLGKRDLLFLFPQLDNFCDELSLSSCLSNSSGKGICSHWSGSNDVIELRERELLYRSRTGAITQEMRSVEGKEGIHFLSHLTRRIGFDEEKGEPVIIIITGLWPSPSVCGDCGQCTTKACQRWKPIQEVASRSDIIIPLLRYTQTLGLIRWKEMNPRQNKSDDPTTTNKKNFFFSSGFLYQRGGQWRQIKRLRQLLPVLLVRAWKEAILLELLLLTLWFGACVSADILFFWLFFFFFFSCIAFSRLPFHSLSLATVHGRLGSVLLSLLLLLSSHYGARRGWTLVTYLVSHLLAAGATTGKGKCFIVCLLIASLRCAIIILHASRFGCDRVTNQIRIASTVLTWVYSHTARTWQSNRLLPVPTQSFFEKKKYIFYINKWNLRRRKKDLEIQRLSPLFIFFFISNWKEHEWRNWIEITFLLFPPFGCADRNVWSVTSVRKRKIPRHTATLLLLAPISLPICL